MILTEKQKNSLINRLLNGSIPEPNTGCWLWEKSEKYLGYGAIGIGRKVHFAHRASYLVFKGNIPKNKVVRHKCDTPQCVNPDHLILGTVKDNSNDMVIRRRHKSHKTNKCANGHEFTPENTAFVFNSRINRDQKVCRICRKKRQLDWYNKQPKKPPYKKPFKEFCKYGHKYEGENIVMRNNGKRICRECQKRQILEKKQKRRLGILKT